MNSWLVNRSTGFRAQGKESGFGRLVFKSKSSGQLLIDRFHLCDWYSAELPVDQGVMKRNESGPDQGGG